MRISELIKYWQENHPQEVEKSASVYLNYYISKDIPTKEINDIVLNGVIQDIIKPHLDDIIHGHDFINDPIAFVELKIPIAEVLSLFVKGVIKKGKEFYYDTSFDNTDEYVTVDKTFNGYIAFIDGTVRELMATEITISFLKNDKPKE